MKALVYADVHADDGSERCFNNRAESLQRWRVKKFYADAAKIFELYGCDCVWDLGDTTNSRHSIPIPTIDDVIDGISKFPAHPLNFKLVGNHEQFLKSCDVHAGKLFSSRFNVIEEPAVVAHGGTIYALCPFIYDLDQLANWLEAVLEDHPGRRKVLLGHFQLAGSKTAAGEVKDGVPKDAVKDFDLVLLGHIHRPQSIFKHVHYVGSPFQQNRGEAGEQKRVGVVDLETLDVTWVKLEGYPQYITCTFEQYKNLACEQSEDRFQVVLEDPQEAEKFYAHPLSSRASPVYRYDARSCEVNQLDRPACRTEDPAAGDVVVDSWVRTRKTTILKYFEANPPKDRGITMPEDELLKLAEQLAGDE